MFDELALERESLACNGAFVHADCRFFMSRFDGAGLICCFCNGGGGFNCCFGVFGIEAIESDSWALGSRLG